MLAEDDVSEDGVPEEDVPEEDFPEDDAPEAVPDAVLPDAAVLLPEAVPDDVLLPFELEVFPSVVLLDADDEFPDEEPITVTVHGYLLYGFFVSAYTVAFPVPTAVTLTLVDVFFVSFSTVFDDEIVQKPTFFPLILSVKEDPFLSVLLFALSPGFFTLILAL